MLGRITRVAIVVVHRYTLAEGLLDVGLGVIQSRKNKVMSEMKLPITPEICFRGITYTHIILTESAQKYYGAMSVPIYNCITFITASRKPCTGSRDSMTKSTGVVKKS